MSGKVACRFIGGPRGEEMLTLPAIACQDTVTLAIEAWIAEGPDGRLIAIKGSVTPRAPWITFTRDVYRKVVPTEPGNVTYQFVGTEQVNRCAKLVPKKGRRCGNEAEPNSAFCRVHRPSR